MRGAHGGAVGRTAPPPSVRRVPGATRPTVAKAARMAQICAAATGWCAAVRAAGSSSGGRSGTALAEGMVATYTTANPLGPAHDRLPGVQGHPSDRHLSDARRRWPALRWRQPTVQPSRSNSARRLISVSHGLGLVVVLLGGFGLLARLGVMHGADVARLGLGQAGHLGGHRVPWWRLPYRRPDLARLVFIALPVLGGLAAWLAIYKPF